MEALERDYHSKHPEGTLFDSAAMTMKTVLCEVICAAILAMNSPVIAQPAFLSSRLAADGHLQLQLNTGQQPYVIQASSDLKSWTQVSSGNGSNAVVQFEDPASGLGRRFYRAYVTGTRPANSPPINDSFGISVELFGSPATASGSNANATEEIGEPPHAYFNSGSHSVWWKWTAPSDGQAIVSTMGTHFDTLLAVYTGNQVTNLTVAAKNRYSSKQISFDASAGQTYHIAVDGNNDASGPIQLSLVLSNRTSAPAPSGVAGRAVLLNETSDPNVPVRLVTISNDGKLWSDVENGTTNVIESGTVESYSASGSTGTLTVQAVGPNGTDEEVFTFEFETRVSGNYSYTIDGSPGGSGRFSDFRELSAGLAPGSLAPSQIVLTRLTSSLGTAGQTHFLTIGPNSAFDNSDGDASASGAFSYSASGANATLKLQYNAPAAFNGDQSVIQMQFTSPTSGSYTNTYTRNDGTVLVFGGQFSLEYQ